MALLKNQWFVTRQSRPDSGDGYQVVLRCKETNIGKLSSDIAQILASDFTSCRQLLSDGTHLACLELTFKLRVQAEKFVVDLPSNLPGVEKEPALIKVN